MPAAKRWRDRGSLRPLPLFDAIDPPPEPPPIPPPPPAPSFASMVDELKKRIEANSQGERECQAKPN